jgi:predicted phosphodiesterase
MESWQDKVRQLRQLGLNWMGITELMHNEYFPTFSFSQAYEKIRHLDKSHKKLNMNVIKEKPCSFMSTEESLKDITPFHGTNTLVFSDTHIPFNHPNFLQFLKDTYAKYNCGPIVCLGDLVDHHALSRHDSEGCAKSPYDELNMALEEVKKYVEAFPNVKMCKGNHDEIVVRQSKTLGIGERFLKSFSELYCIPDTWDIADEHIINGVLHVHGINCGGKDGAINKSVKECMSTVIGHSHAYAGCKYHANARDLMFGLNVGCGIDINAYAFAYGQHSIDRPIIGCGVVYNSSHAEFIPMPREYFRSA